MTLIVGHMGSMGKRHSAILKHLEEPFKGFDPSLGHSFDEFNFTEFDRFIIATPTPTHLFWIKNLETYNKPILSEKPLSNNIREIEEILDVSCPLSLQVQYKYFDNKFSEGDSWYHYYNHGKDGLIWDCFQIIALARGHVDLGEHTPLWGCGLNGKTLDLREMDIAYVWSVSQFLKGQYIPRETMLNWHRKVLTFGAKWKK